MPEEELNNPFNGMDFRSAVDLLRRQPELVSQFDAVFKDEEQVATFERARRHVINSMFRGSPEGALALKGMKDLIDRGPPEEDKEQEKNAHELWAERLGMRGGQAPKPITKMDIYNETKQKYESIVGDLLEFDRMSASWNADDPALEIGAAIGGALVGSFPSITSALYFPVRGVTATARIGFSALQGGTLNAAVDPAVQLLNMKSGIQKDFDYWQWALSFPAGAVINGGIVGGGEVVSKALLRSEMSQLAKFDPSMQSPTLKATESIKELPKKITEEAEAVMPQIEERRAPMRAEPPQVPDYAHPPESTKSLHTLSEELEQAFGIPIRQGRMPVSKALGTYTPSTGVIHVQAYPDFSINMHEVAHGLERLIGPDISRNGGLIQTHAAELKLLDYDQDPIIGQRAFEGFAEYMRLYVTNPAYATNHAPAFTSEFQNLLERKNPEMLAKLLEFRKAYDDHRRALPEQAVKAIVHVPKETWGDTIAEKLTQEKIPPTARNIVRGMYESAAYHGQPIYTATRELGKGIRDLNKGKLVNLLPSEDPRVIFEQYRKAHQIAIETALEGVRQSGDLLPSGPSAVGSLAHAIGEPSLTARWNEEMFHEWGTYLTARAGIERWMQFYQGKIKNDPLSVPIDTLVKTVDEMNKKYPRFQHASNMLFEYHRNLLKKAHEAGVPGITDEMYNAALQNPFYMPLNRKITDIQTGQAKEKLYTIKGFEGSLRDVIHPFMSTIEITTAIERAVLHNKMAHAFEDLAEKAQFHGGKIFEPIPPHETKKIEFDLKDASRRAMEQQGWIRSDANQALDNLFGPDYVNGTVFKKVRINGKEEPIIVYGKNGELRAARVAKRDEGIALYEAWTQTPTPAQDLFSQVMAFSANQMVAGVVAHPAYVIRNVFRDQLAAAFYVPGYIPYYHGFLGLKGVVKNDEFYKMYKQFGGVDMTLAIAPKSEMVEADMRALAQKGYKLRKLTSLRGLAEVLSTFENATRVGVTRVVYNQKIKQGLSQVDAAMTAVREATDLFDPSRYGLHTKIVRDWTPFLNAWEQGLLKLGRAGVMPAVRKMMKDEVFEGDKEQFNKALWLYSSFGLMSLGMGYAFDAMFGDSPVRQDAGPAAIAGNIIIPLGDVEGWYLPKPWELGIGFTAGEYLSRQMRQGDPRAAKEFGKAVAHSIAGPVPFFGSPVKSIVEATADYSFFTGRPIVPEKLKGIEPEFYPKAQFGTLSRTIGKLTGWSPAKVNHVISGLGGYYGKDVTLMGKGNEDDTVIGSFIDWTLLRVGIKDPFMASTAREKFWEYLKKDTGELTQAVKNFNYLVRDARNDEGARAYFSKLTEAQKVWVTMYSAAKADGRPAFTSDNRASHPLVRAKEAVGVLSGMRNDIITNRLTSEGAPLVITPDTRKRLTNLVSQMALAEMVNAMITIREPGFENRPLFDMNVYMTQLKAASPEVADEVANRYATEKIYKSSVVAENYPAFKSILLSGGSDANVTNITSIIKAQGYEFGTLVRRTKKPIRRITIEGTGQ